MTLASGGARVGLTALRWRARAPRLALLGTCGVLSTIGVSTIVDPSRTDRVVRPGEVAAADAATLGFAEAFIRSSLAEHDGVQTRRQRARRRADMAGGIAPAHVNADGPRIVSDPEDEDRAALA
jgi:hypothetical protein